MPRVWTEDQKRQVSESLKGREKSPETREKLRQANLGKISPQRGVPRSEEVRAKISAGRKGKPVSLATRQKISSTLRQDGFHLDRKGYIILTGQQGHPLASPRGILREHRKVLYGEIGPGEHPCHWCGEEISWEARTLVPDHLDWNTSNTDPENLVPACYPCNSARKNPQTDRWVPYHG